MLLYHSNKQNKKKMNNRYMQRGVSAAKEDVHAAIKNIDKGLFPQAFCKIIPDILGGDPEYCNIMHADGARAWPICIGRRLVISAYGKASHRTPSS